MHTIRPILCGLRFSTAWGFYFGNKAKTHFNLCEIAIVKEKQNRGYGTALLKRIKNICKENNINTITLRARKGSPAEKWWRSRGGNYRII